MRIFCLRGRIFQYCLSSTATTDGSALRKWLTAPSHGGTADSYKTQGWWIPTIEWNEPYVDRVVEKESAMVLWIPSDPWIVGMDDAPGATGADAAAKDLSAVESDK